MASIDNFPDISFIDDTTIEDVVTQMINDYQDRYKELTGKEVSLAAANPFRLLIYACAVQIYQGMQYADHAGKMSFLKYAYGAYLDSQAALRGLERIEAKPATTTLKFSITAPIQSAVAIPMGCRVTNGNDVFFATDEYAEIAAGQTSVEVKATCTEAGVIGNGFLPGEFTSIVNSLPYVVSATNTTNTMNGADRESDENFKDRIMSVPESYSTAGPAGAYIYQTKTASSEIGDVAVSSPNPSEVVVKFIMNDGSMPDADMIAYVQDYLDGSKIRPLTDEVTVGAPTAETYNINVTYYIAKSDSSAVASIQENITAAVSAYNIWQTSKIGRDINPSYLIQKVMEAGAKRVSVISPTHTVLSDDKIAKTGTVTVTYGGIEDD